ncbi:MAG: ribonuclease R [Trueperaceae bacterium]|nr:ribonuclease R [Trueperaceae bacterium]
MSTFEPERLQRFFQEHPERPWHVQDVQKELEVDDRAELKRALDALVDAGALVRTRRRTYGLPEEMNLIPGRLQVAAGGYGFVIRDSGEGKDLFVPADKLGGAWDGDKVLARPNQLKEDDDRPAGEVVRIVERRNAVVVGTLEYAQGYAILRPDSPRLRERILLTPDSVGKLDGGLRLMVRMIWPEESGEREPFGQVEEVLGEQDDPEVETRAVIVKHDLKETYDPDTLAEAAAVPDHVTAEMMEGRTDYRDVPTFTIDGADAKDFDDAISLERLKGKDGGTRGNLRIGVHIADVSYYVAEGTSLDREARERATTCYLPGRVLPMLPEELSNGICSLIEGTPRLALSAFADVTREGEVTSVEFKETVIASDARFTYEDVQGYADGGRLPHGKRKLERDVKVLLNLAQKLREQRLGAGALDFDFTEAKVDVDDSGALHLQPIRSNAARQLIEEMMLLANRLVASELEKRDIPALYRVHEDPSEQKIEALQKSLARLGYTLDLNQATPKDLQAILREAAGKPEAQLVNTLLLRSLKQARYSSENLGHFGLAFENYLHFTSPIRRYPDLVVHRVMRAMLQHRLSPTLKERLKSDFPELAKHASERERVAEQAERDLARYYHARWAKEHLGEVFTGTVSGVTNFGVFVTLPNGIEGLMHVSHLEDDYYVFLEESLMLMGKSTRTRYRMGDRLEVRLYQANPTARQIDLIPGNADMPEVVPEETPKRSKPPKKLKTPLGGAKDAPPLSVDAGKARAGGKKKAAAKGGRAEAGEAAAEAGPAKAAAKSGSKSGAKGKAAAKAKPEAKEAADAKPKAEAKPKRGAKKDEAEAKPASEAKPKRGRKAKADPKATAEAAPAKAPPAADATQNDAAPDEKGHRRRRRLVFGDKGPRR